MAFNKKNIFPDSEQRIAAIAKALSHPARIVILRELAQRNTCVCGEIVEVLPLSQATVSQHLKELKQAGVISGTVDGTKSCYCIDWQVFDDYRTSVINFLNELQKPVELIECC